jgi:hypothetical protein
MNVNNKQHRVLLPSLVLQTLLKQHVFHGFANEAAAGLEKVRQTVTENDQVDCDPEDALWSSIDIDDSLAEDQVNVPDSFEDLNEDLALPFLGFAENVRYIGEV